MFSAARAPVHRPFSPASRRAGTDRGGPRRRRTREDRRRHAAEPSRKNQKKGPRSVSDDASLSTLSSSVMVEPIIQMPRHSGMYSLYSCGLHSYGLYSYGLCSYGLCSYGPYSYGLYSYDLYSYGLCSYGLYSYGLYSYGLYKGTKIINGRRSNSNQNGAALTLSGHFPAPPTPLVPRRKSVLRGVKKTFSGQGVDSGRRIGISKTQNFWMFVMAP